MQEQLLFEYAVIRIVPRVEREEFLNVGLVIYCAAKGFLKCKFELNENRLLALYNEIDVKEVEDYLNAFQQVCKGGKEAGTIGMLPIASRFRWLTATRSTVVQTSKVHPGFCNDPEAALEKLFNDMVG